MLQYGLDRVAEDPHQASQWGHCALLANQASVDHRLQPSWQVLQGLLGSRLKALFGPQHGFESVVQDNMIETSHGRHLASGLPVYSLYSETREPTEEMLAGIDTIVCDMQHSGCRVYTYKYTVAACLRAAKKYGKRVVVLDRPNPLGGRRVAGRVLDLDVRSFVGEFAIPLQHGLTIGELAVIFNESIGAELTVVPVMNWNPERTWLGQTEAREWVLTSPNLPSIEAALVFPGMVLLEGTNLSEGRGTCLPFLFCGAPYIKNAHEYVRSVARLLGEEPTGVHLRPTSFQPTSGKWQGETCNGMQIHVVNPELVSSVPLGIAAVRAAYEANQVAFAWKQPPYEYEYEKLPINLILGSSQADARLKSDEFSLRDEFWSAGLKDFVSSNAPHLLYERKMQG